MRIDLTKISRPELAKKVWEKTLSHFYRRIEWFKQISLLSVYIIADQMLISHFMRVKQWKRPFRFRFSALLRCYKVRGTPPPLNIICSMFVSIEFPTRNCPNRSWFKHQNMRICRNWNEYKSNSWTTTTKLTMLTNIDQMVVNGGVFRGLCNI
jgi:hypothetical protein